jgi:anti-sigma B factor antagonist
MTVSERRVGGVTILDIAGGLKLGDGAAELNALIRRLIEQGRTRIILNVAGVEFVDSAGLGALVQAHVSATAVSGVVRLLNTPKRLNDLLVITKLARVLHSSDNEAEAVASLERTGAAG